MEFPDTYFEDEVREGFFIPSLMKRAWAAQMEVLEIVQGICNRHQIRYFAEWGTLLGVVRHGGRIPWDDDVDLCMLRQDYDRFCEVAADELPKECMFFDYHQTDGFDQMLGRIINSRVHVVEGEYLEKYHGFPYVAGIDLFWLDDLTERNGLEEVTNLHVWMENRNFRLPKKCYDIGILLPFENTSIAVPAGYDEILTKKYGKDWRTPVRSGGLHDYPSYAKQQKFLEEEQAAELFEYQYSRKELEKFQSLRESGDTLKKKVTGFTPLFQTAHQEICQAIQDGKIDQVQSLLGTCQETAIQIGTWIEEEEGENHPVVGRLEQYCELLFQIHTGMAEGTNVNYTDFSKVCEGELSDFIEDFSRLIGEELQERKQVVFVPYKASLWGSMESVWQAAMEDENTVVFVVPALYYYKNADGSAKTDEPHYETEGYPENVPITFYEDYNFQENHPDLIIIQCPYDEYNYGMTLHPFFYAKNLGKYTDRLVYIPAFVVDEIGPGGERARETLKTYCNTPGVVYADLVIVQSEQMKQTYVELLTEFAGENTRAVWEQKIVGSGSPLYDRKAVLKEAIAIPEQWRQRIEKPDGSWKKVILYSTSASAILHYGQDMLDQMKRVCSVFRTHQDEIALLWLPDLNAKQILQNSHELWKQYQQFVQEYCQDGWGIYVGSPEKEQALQICDACYGTSADILNQCRNRNKVVKMEEEL